MKRRLPVLSIPWNSAGNQSGPGGIPVCRNGGRGPVGIAQLGSGSQAKKLDVHGGSSQAPTREIGLSGIQNVFAEASICPERMKLLPKSWRGTHFEATATRFEYS